jgi:hypothetical protein
MALEPADEVEELGTCKYHFGVGPLSGAKVPLHPQSPSCVEWTPADPGPPLEDPAPISDDVLESWRRGGWTSAQWGPAIIARIDAEVARRQDVEEERDRLREALDLWRGNVSPRDSYGKCWWCGSNRTSSGADGIDGHYEPCPSHTALAPTEALS